jgi:hypothetical protein
MGGPEHNVDSASSSRMERGLPSRWYEVVLGFENEYHSRSSSFKLGNKETE